MRYVVLFLISTLGLAPLALAAKSGDVEMTGIASYTELRRPYYIGALYLDQPVVSSGQVLSSWGKRRMEMRITAERWTPRRFSSQWTQALILNVEPGKLEKYADAFVQFNNLPRNAFQKGDHIVIASDKKGRTRVSVNGTEMFKENKPGFFEVLLATWLGDKPPSTEFKQAVMGNVDAALMVEYNALQPGAERTAVVAAWLHSDATQEELAAASEEQDQQVAAADTKAESSASEKQNMAESAAVVAAAGVTVAAVATPAAAPVAVTEEVAAIADTVSVRDVVPEPEVAKPGKTTADKPAQLVAMAPTARGRAANTDEIKIDPEIYRLQQETLLKLYRSSIMKRALRQVKYPKAAVRRGQEGTVMLELTVDRSGEVLLLEQTKVTRYKSLNSAALAAVAAVADAGALPPVPAGLEGRKIKVNIPVIFALQ